MYRLRAGVHLICVKDRDGKVNYHYSRPQPQGRDFGPAIPWLSPRQAAHLLRCNMVELIDDDPASGGEPVAVTAADRVRECVDALEQLGVPADAGALKARDALRDGAHRFGNDVVAAAVKVRKALSGTA